MERAAGVIMGTPDTPVSPAPTSRFGNGAILKWAVGLIVVVALPLLGYAFAQGGRAADVKNLKAAHDEQKVATKARFDKIEALQFQDGRDLTKVMEAVESIRRDVAQLRGDVRTFLKEARKGRRGRMPRWYRPPTPPPARPKP
jgi:hypothetical protein